MKSSTSLTLIKSERTGNNFYAMRARIDHQLYMGNLDVAKQIRKDYIYEKFYDDYDLDSFEIEKLEDHIKVIRQMKNNADGNSKRRKNDERR